jgi:hypothetical protein
MNQDTGGVEGGIWEGVFFAYKYKGEFDEKNLLAGWREKDACREAHLWRSCDEASCMSERVNHDFLCWNRAQAQPAPFDDHFGLGINRANEIRLVSD